MTKTIGYFFIACRRGFPMISKNALSWLNIIVLLSGIIALVWNSKSQIFNHVIGVVIYVVVAIAFALIPYRGQKAITDEQEANYEKILKNNNDERDENHKLIEKLKQEIKISGGTVGKTKFS